MRKLLAAVAVCLSGCSDAEPTPSPRASPNAEFTHNQTSGGTRARIAPRGEEAALVRSGPSVPPSLPRGFTLYPGAKVLSSTVVERAGDELSLAILETPDPVGDVMAHYRKEARVAGLEMAFDVGGRERASLGGRIPSGQTVVVSAQRTGAVTRIEFAAH